MVYLIPLLIFGLIIFFSSFFVVKQQSSVIVERFGRFHSISNSGLQLKIPIIDPNAGRVKLRIQQLPVIIETKTKDKAFVKLSDSVQFKGSQEKVYEAF